MRKFIHVILFIALAMALPAEIWAEPRAVVEIVDFDVQEPEISVEGSSIRVRNANGMTLSVYNVAGVCVMQIKVEGADKSFDFNLAKGCYILKVGKVVRKVSIK